MSPSAAPASRSAAAGSRSAAQTGTPARRPVGPRRVSGPASPAGPAHPAEPLRRPIARPASPAPFSQHVARVVDNSLLDRLIRGRAWIGLIAFALIGIVAMQVALLKLNSGISHSISRATALQRESSLLSAQVAELSSAARIQVQASQLGMVYAPPDDVRYLRSGAGDAARAAAAFVAPASSPTGSTGAAGSTGASGSSSITGSGTAPAGSSASTGP